MSDIIQPPIITHNTDTLNWFNVYNPSWETLIALGYLNGAEARPTPAKVEGLSNSDGEVEACDCLKPFVPGVVDQAGTEFFIVSSDAADTGTYEVHTVEGDGSHGTLTGTMTGTTPVSLGSTARHYNLCIYVAPAGNVGTIHISEKSTAGTPILADNLQFAVAPGVGTAFHPTQYCPDDHVFIVPAMTISCSKNDGIVMRIYKGVYGQSIARSHEFLVYNATFQQEFVVPLVVQPGEFLSYTLERTDGTNISVSLETNRIVLHNHDYNDGVPLPIFNVRS